MYAPAPECTLLVVLGRLDVLVLDVLPLALPWWLASVFCIVVQLHIHPC